MIVRTSDVLPRAIRSTPQKRIEQNGLIKCIQQRMGTRTPEGDIIQTPGPGNVALNYLMLERMFHPNTKYIAVEYNRTLILKMNKEAVLLRKKLRAQAWSNKITVSLGELFKYSTKYARNNKILLVDACFCVSPSVMVKDGILESLELLLKTQEKQNFFFAWTFTQRGHGEKDKQAVKEVNKLIKKFNGELIYDCSYKDGAPMKSMAWHINKSIN